eukprot:scaffold1877_cov67-Phaeocystis_antarctica.AAC.10
MPSAARCVKPARSTGARSGANAEALAAHERTRSTVVVARAMSRQRADRRRVRRRVSRLARRFARAVLDRS